METEEGNGKQVQTLGEVHGVQETASNAVLWLSGQTISRSTRIKYAGDLKAWGPAEWNEEITEFIDMMGRTPQDEDTNHAVPMPQEVFERWLRGLSARFGKCSREVSFAVLVWTCAARTADVLALQLRDIEEIKGERAMVIDFVRSKQYNRREKRRADRWVRFEARDGAELETLKFVLQRCGAVRDKSAR